MTFLQQVEQLMSPIGNYSKYRAILKVSRPPLLPFQGVYLADLTFIDEVPSKLDNGMINFSKMNLVSGIFTEIMKFQAGVYNIIELPYIVDYWKRTVVMSEKELYDIAKKMKRTTQESSSLRKSDGSRASFNGSIQAIKAINKMKKNSSLKM